ncbi:hypothetical protein BC835DRAFT_1023757 [Cytidiella melzeri]|nr:hypothetical protein BC835DRAFT_1023757 [Cytidiella melzeri]
MHHFRIFGVLAALAAVASSFVILIDQDVEREYSLAYDPDGPTNSTNHIGTPTVKTSRHARRTVGGVYICTDINWGGTCGYAVQAINQCIVLGSDWNKQISSFGPDECTICYAYSSNDCVPSATQTAGSEWTFTYPGDDTGGLYSGGVPWNDQISSFICEGWCTSTYPAATQAARAV